VIWLLAQVDSEVFKGTAMQNNNLLVYLKTVPEHNRYYTILVQGFVVEHDRAVVMFNLMPSKQSNDYR